MNKTVVDAVQTAVKDLEYDVTKRNNYINKREKYLYGKGLWEQIDFEVGQWFAEYNYLLRVVDVHASQLMGRGFDVYSYYDKEDLTPYEENPDELKLAELRNKKAKANADLRKKAVDAIIRDNGGYSKFKDGARLGSAFGTTIYKMWYEKDNKKVRVSLLESPQNYRAGWTDSDFRDRDFDAYIWQVSENRAYRDYGKILKPNEMFVATKAGQPFNVADTDPREAETERKMVTVVEYNGYLPGWSGKDGKLKKVKRGDETPVNIQVVGGKLAQIITDETLLPQYYIINNRQEPRAAWGKSDLPQSALDINQEIVQLQADMMTWANKNLFKLIQAKGFTPEGIPKKKPRKMQVIAMSPEQSLEEMETSFAQIDEFEKLINSKMEAFVRITGVGRVLFDDPSVNANSNQALMTTLKPVIDIVEDKQARWEPVLQQMFTDALHLAARDVKELKDAVETDENWFLCIEWPSVLRKEDSAYQSMYMNRVAQGLISLETYMEKMGDDYSEEMDRLGDEMKNKVSAAILGKQIGSLAAALLAPPPDPTAGQPDVKYNVSVKADATTDPMANRSLIEVVDPQLAAQGAPSPQDPAAQGSPEQYSPQVNPDQNNPATQAPSIPGSGQPQVSPEGAVAQQLQNQGS